MAGCYERDKYLLELVTLSCPQVSCEKDKDGCMISVFPNPSMRPLELGALDSVSYQNGAKTREVAVGVGRLAQSPCTLCWGLQS